MAQNIKPRGRMGKMTKELSLAIKKKKKKRRDHSKQSYKIIRGIIGKEWKILYQENIAMLLLKNFHQGNKT